MASLESILIGAVELIAGAFLLATGIGGGLGAKLLLAGALTLVSAFMSARTGQNGFKSSPTYGYDNLGNAQFEGSPIPIVYGEHLVKPGIISTNLKSVGGVQVLYLLCLISEGGAAGIESVSQVRLNGVALESFNGLVESATATVRLGTADQTVIPGFNETGSQYPGNGTLLSNGATFIHDMRAAADALTVELIYQSGLFAISKGGNVSDAASDVKVEYRAHGTSGTGGWSTFPITAEDAKTWTPNPGKTAGVWETWGADGVHPKSRDPQRLPIELRFDGRNGRPARGRYEVRVTGLGPVKTDATNFPSVVSVIEVNNDSRAYPGLALLGLKLPGSAQLNGIPTISCVVKGRKVLDPRTGLTAWSDNTVLCAYDLLTNSTYGGGNETSKLPLSVWNAMADACDATVTPVGVSGATPEARWRLDYVVDAYSPITDHVVQMLATCRMTLANPDRKIYVVQDAAGTANPDAKFEARAAASSANRRNVRDTGSPPRSTLVASSLDALQRYTRVRLVYVDRNRDWQQRRVEIFDQYVNVGAIAGGSFGVGNKVKGTTSKAVGILTATYANGAPYLTFAQDDGATPFVSGETVTDLTSGASATTSSVPYTASPERVLDVQMYGITRRTQAVREARYMLNNARSRTQFVTWGGFLGDLQWLPGEIVPMSADHLPWTEKPLTLLTTGFDAEGLATFHAREYVADVYSDNVDTTQVDSLAFVPGGAVPPGLRDPGISKPSDTGSTANVANIDQSSFFGAGSGNPSSVPFGGVSSISVTTAPVGLVPR